MKIDFYKTHVGYQQARKLRQVLADCNNENNSNDVRILIDDLLQQIDNFLADQDNEHGGSSFSAFFSSLWNFISGPSQRELELSKQRKELVERAEHAENIAFQALAETSDIKEKFEEAQQKIRALEQELEKNRS